MKSKTILLIFLSAMLFIALKPHGGEKNSGQAPLGRTGAPGETTCGGCHSGGSYSGSMTFEFGTENGSEYEPGETYVITFIGDYGAPRYGFSITVLDADDNPAGDFTLINEDNTSFGTLANGRQYVGHKAADATNEWTFEWTAPSQDVGPVTFYYVINAANGDGGTGGDFVETGSTSIQPAEEPETYMITFIIEDETGEPIPDAVITLAGDEYEAGFYVFEDLPPASYEYTVSRDGYFDKSGTVDLIDDDVSITVVLEIDETPIADVDDTGLVTIFPNPATSHVTIRTNYSEMEALNIFDMQGRLVHQVIVGNHEYSVDVSALDPAIYLLQVRTADQTSVHRIFIKP